MKGKVCIEFLSGDYESTALCINDYRITPNKAWGRAKVEFRYYLDYDFLKNSCDKDGKIHFEVYRKTRQQHELFINGQPTQGNIPLEDFQEHLKKIEARIKRFDRTPGEHHWELCRRYQCMIDFSTIEQALTER